MTLGRFLNSSRSLVSVNDTGYFDPDVMTPQACFGTALKINKKLSGKRLILVVGRRYGSMNCKN